MSEMNSPRDDVYTTLNEKFDGLLINDPTNVVVFALKEALVHQSRGDAEATLERLEEALTGGGARDLTLEALAPHMSYGEIVWYLGRSENARFTPELIRALQHNDAAVRQTAADALRRVKDSASLPALIETLRDGHPSVREMAATALGEIRDPRATLALIDVLRDSASHVRQATAKALGEIGDPISVMALSESLEDENILVAIAAGKALGKMNDAAAFSVLTSALQGDDTDARFVAAAALRQLGEFRDPAVILALRNQLTRETDTFVRAEIMGALRKLERVVRSEEPL